MGERALTCRRGRLLFTWRITDSQIQVYQWDEGAAQPQLRLGWLALTGEDGLVLPFEQEAFEAHIDWFFSNVEATEPGEAAEG